MLAEGSGAKSALAPLVTLKAWMPWLTPVTKTRPPVMSAVLWPLPVTFGVGTGLASTAAPGACGELEAVPGRSVAVDAGVPPPLESKSPLETSVVDSTAPFAPFRMLSRLPLPTTTRPASTPSPLSQTKPSPQDGHGDVEGDPPSVALTAFTRPPPTAYTVPLSSVGVAPVPANDVVHTVEPLLAQAAQQPGVGGHHEDPTVVDDGLRPGDALAWRGPDRRQTVDRGLRDHRLVPGLTLAQVTAARVSQLSPGAADALPDPDRDGKRRDGATPAMR